MTYKINRALPLTMAYSPKYLTLYPAFDRSIWTDQGRGIGSGISDYMAYMSAKFDEEAHDGLVSIAFTSLFPYMSIVTLTFELQNR